jgi:hypothetical protein
MAESRALVKKPEVDAPLEPFLVGVVRPLVCGGAIEVGAPVRLEVARAWQTMLAAGAFDPGAVDDIDAARAARAALLVVAPPPLPLDGEALALALAIYDALVAVHPEAVGASKRLGRRILATAQLLAELPPARTLVQLLSRHTLLANLIELGRRDLHLRWWTGHADFRGQSPPGRLLAWAGVRRVRSSETRASWHELLAPPVAEALLMASPLTDCLPAGRAGTPLHWANKAPLLAHAELLRAVAYHGAAVDAEAWRAAAGAAWVILVDDEQAPPELVAQVTSLLAYVSLLALEAGALAPVDPEGPMQGARAFWALPRLVTQVAPQWLAGLERDVPASVRAAWLATAERAAASIPGPRRETLLARLGEALPRSRMAAR